MLKKFIYLFLGVILSFQAGLKASAPNEGMWLPLLIKQLNYGEMQKMGCKLTAEQIYSVNNASLKDAIAQLGGFCTAEVVSPEGLLLTNHHCAYDAIQTHSSKEKDYLANGFWAMNKGEELHTPGLTASFLIRMEDVTDRIMKAAESVGEADKEMKIQEEIGKIEEEAKEGNHYRSSVESMLYGNAYYLFVYETFRDVRLVGAPPSSIGKFGGDTDNWMWPRHTGDFSMLRVYAGPDNKPADYAAENVPLKPRHFLPVNIKGVKQGDFSMIMGFPGSTDRYLTSFAIKQAYENDNPDFVDVFGERLRVMKEDMDADRAVAIKLASDYASLANTYKYFQGQNLGLSRRGLIEERQAYESKFQAWVSKDAKRKDEYGKVLEGIQNNIQSNATLKHVSNYFNLSLFGTGFVGTTGFTFYRAVRTLEAGGGKDAVMGMLNGAFEDLGKTFKDYNTATDQKVFASMLRMYRSEIPAEYHPDFFESKLFTKSKAKGNMDQYDVYASKVFASSFLVSRDRIEATLAKLESMDEAKIADFIKADPGVAYLNSVIDMYRKKILTGMAIYQGADEELMHVYMKGMREMESDKAFYPDANSTLRLTYGKVIPYDPRDGVTYKYTTTANGILEKEVPGDEEFDVHPKLKQLIQARDFGRYGHNGELTVCFLTDHDITGGNSGSPVIDGEGNLIGIAFDGNWESMTSDLVFDKDIVRTINVSAEYVLFVIDKFAGAGHLIKEMKVIE